MRDLAVDERLRDHADHLAARGQRRVGDRAHQPDARAAVDEADARAGERAAERGGRLRVVGMPAGAGAGEDAEPFAWGRRESKLAAHGPEHLQGVRRARPLRRADRRRRRRAGRARVRPRARRPARQGDDASCASGSGATCGSPPRSSPAATATGSSPRASHVLDAGMVGTEMLYFLVGSRELDGGLMCTASHNPKAYTGAKLVREGALALSGDAGIGEMRDLCAAGLPPADGRARERRGGRRPRRLRGARPLVRRRRGDQADEGRARRRQRDGGADGRPAARPIRGPGAGRRPTGSPTASSPTTSPTRCCRRTGGS